ncbi:DNA-binding response regulator CreB [Klebsiella pneumoniae]|uniref:winged helix-turn-helix domain-containing protein n=1 Tax=Klebsiella pneumoniae TaxID=573 RepID=UPI000E2A9677|nr:winged helix-turn-helix domain-containing protein [Klebsiella pneumoniae]SVN22621.1 DNA-binding response regulator CreB [Klebsiella pneumoniae]
MQQPRIWLVEDEQSIADTLVYMLQQEGFQVSVFGRGLPAPSPVVRVGEFVLDEQAAAISWFGQPLNLTRYEFLLLKTLLHAPGRVFSRQQLMELVWIDAWESLDRTVDTHIKTLRAKLRAVNPEKAPINTHRGMGYSLGRG